MIPYWSDLQKKKINEKLKQKMRIFSSLSHELRTPLNCSISLLENFIQYIHEKDEDEP